MPVGVGSPEEAGTQQEETPGMRAAKSSESRKESSEHFRRTHLGQVQHCPDLPRRVTFAAHTKYGKTGQGLG